MVACNFVPSYQKKQFEPNLSNRLTGLAAKQPATNDTNLCYRRDELTSINQSSRMDRMRASSPAWRSNKSSSRRNVDRVSFSSIALQTLLSLAHKKLGSGSRRWKECENWSGLLNSRDRWVGHDGPESGGVGGSRWGAAAEFVDGERWWWPTSGVKSAKCALYTNKCTPNSLL